MNKSHDEPIVAKIISSNINSEEDDYILNTTMDKIENMDKFKDKYKKNQLETELQLQQSSLEKLDEYTAMIENYKKKENYLVFYYNYYN